MNVKTVPVSTARRSCSYKVNVGFDTLGEAGRWAKDLLGTGARKVAVISNPKVNGLYGAKVGGSLRKEGLEPVSFLIKDGERHKNLKTFGEILGFLGGNKVGRTDAVLALGGGVVGDVAGFAAAAHLRGLAFLQIPTTLLSMIDSSVGGKTGVNTPQG